MFLAEPPGRFRDKGELSKHLTPGGPDRGFWCVVLDLFFRYLTGKFHQRSDARVHEANKTNAQGSVLLLLRCCWCWCIFFTSSSVTEEGAIHGGASIE